MHWPLWYELSVRPQKTSHLSFSRSRSAMAEKGEMICESVLQSDLDSAMCWLRTTLKHTDECKGLVFGVFAIVGVGLRGCEMYALMLNRVKGTFHADVKTGLADTAVHIGTSERHFPPPSKRGGVTWSEWVANCPELPSNSMT